MLPTNNDSSEKRFVWICFVNEAVSRLAGAMFLAHDGSKSGGNFHHIAVDTVEPGDPEVG